VNLADEYGLRERIAAMINGEAINATEKRAVLHVALRALKNARIVVDSRDDVLPPKIATRVAVEEASTFGWERYTGSAGTILGLQTFGLSAPIKVVAQHFGFEPAHVVAAAREQIARHSAKR
jgi:transketolase